MEQMVMDEPVDFRSRSRSDFLRMAVAVVATLTGAAGGW